MPLASLHFRKGKLRLGAEPSLAWGHGRVGAEPRQESAFSAPCEHLHLLAGLGAAFLALVSAEGDAETRV